MAKVTPAFITWIPTDKDGNELTQQVLDFHAVMLEDHMASSQVTKYPVQEGFNVTNHSIRNNRVITLEFEISNKVFNLNKLQVGGSNEILESQPSGTLYGNKSTENVAKICTDLVNSGQACTVTTNLGIYTPVVFTRFKTKQEPGKVDSMRVTLTGEEVQVISAENETAPVVLNFKVVRGAERERIVTALAEVGVFAEPCDKISKAEVNKEQSFVVNALNAAGKAVSTTFEFLGNDPVTKASKFLSVLSEDSISVVTGESPSLTPDKCKEEGFDDSLKGGISQVGSCLLGAADDFVTDTVEELVETAMGNLKKGIRGFVYDTVAMDNSQGQALATAGIGCVVRGITGATDDNPYLPGESLPTTEQIMRGEITSRTNRKEVFIKVECDCKTVEQAAASDLPDPKLGAF